jgi:uncharacterized membrane protein YjdF
MGAEASDGRAGGGDPSLGDLAMRALTRTLQIVLLGLVAYTVVLGDAAQFANVSVMLAIAFVPDAVRVGWGVPRLPFVAFLLAAAPFLHAVGGLGPYETVPAFDQVAHPVSAALVAGLGYAAVGAIDADYDDVTVPPKLRAAFVVIFATAFGVAWEILEFGTGLVATVAGGEPFLAQYGPSDVVLDLLFNAVAALLVALWGTTYFEGLRRLARRRAAEDA